MDSEANEPLPDGSLLAAIDLGSNSFHLITAKIEHGEMRPVEGLAEKVQLYVRNKMPEWRRRYNGVETMTVAVLELLGNE